MASFGDVLRGLGSALNPQVAQEAAQEDAQKRALGNQVGMMMLQKRMQEQSPEYQARAEALKNERLFREAAVNAKGDPVKIAEAAVTYGKPELAVNLFNQQEARASRLQQAQDNLELRKTQLAQTHELALARITDAQERQRMQAEFQRANLALKEQGLALQRELAKSNMELRGMKFQMDADQRTRTRVQQLGGALEKASLPEADTVLGLVEDSLKDLGSSKEAKAKELASYIAGPNAWKMDLMISDEAKQARQAAQRLFNITLKNRSGAAVTVPEFERLKQEFSTGVWKKPEQFLNGVKKAREIINRHYASVAAGFGPDVLKAYNENIRGFGGKVVLEGGKVEDPLGIR